MHMSRLMVNHQVLRLGYAVLCACSLLAMHSAHALQPYKADYTFNVDQRIFGKSSRTLQNLPQGWQYTFMAQVPVLASATETSMFKLTPTQDVESDEHTLAYKILIKKKKSKLQFDLQNNQISVQDNGKSSTFKGHPQALDELNLEIQVRRDLARGELKPQYWLADEKGLQPVRFINEGKSSIRTPAGTFDAYAIRRVHKRPTLSSTFWMAPALDYLPIKVVQKDDDTVYEFSLTSYQPMPATSAGAQPPTSANTAR